MLFPSNDPKDSHVTTPDGCPFRATAGVCLRLRLPLAHKITRVPASGLSVEMFYKATAQELHTVGTAPALLSVPILLGGGTVLVWTHDNYDLLRASGKDSLTLPTVALEKGAECAAAGQGQSIINWLPRRNQPSRGPNKLLGISPDALWSQEQSRNSLLSQGMRVECDLALDRFMGTNRRLAWIGRAHYGSTRMVPTMIGSSKTMIQRLEIPRF